MHRTDSNRAGLPVGLELNRYGGKERGPLLLVDRRAQREQQVFLFVGKMQWHRAFPRVSQARRP